MEYHLTQALAASYDLLPLTPGEFDVTRKAANADASALSVEEKYDLALENYLDLERAVLNSAANWMVRQTASAEELRVDSALYNRRILNLLSAGRTYADHVPHHLGAFFEDGSAVAQNALSKAYDSHLGYRTMCALRNYVQHRGMPVHANGYQHAICWDCAHEAHFSHTALLALEPSELELDDGFKSSVLAELKALGRRIDLMWLARDYLDGVSEAHGEIRLAMADVLISADIEIEAVTRRFREATSDASIYLALQSVDESGTLIDRVAVNTLAPSLRQQLATRNPAPLQLASGHVSSEADSGGT
ncbi:MAG: hypothetical protein Q8M66_03125 [Actinomycetota bacterium]|nr:hypothetical protein [Actinomycetota bacterium]MDZ4178329.1 hypothetical protein [Coriobacteriia bacterium]